ncbi:hypothetical protein SAMN04489841_0024 [Natrinema salaciae]|uniref:Uncharacterized protein n=1 Tax=Natrinema salaciae TaxID=1186196 RepID=A0A1H9T402_9EURY|nr:hypothetical protein SAMN04489841_0024 [Natrinema salaciae]
MPVFGPCERGVGVSTADEWSGGINPVLHRKQLWGTVLIICGVNHQYL